MAKQDLTDRRLKILVAIGSQNRWVKYQDVVQATGMTERSLNAVLDWMMDHEMVHQRDGTIGNLSIRLSGFGREIYNLASNGNGKGGH